MRSKRQGRPAGQKKGAQKIQYGGGSKGSTGGKGKKKRPIEDDDDDEEIDEDLAFNEEDERKYGDLLREIAENDERKRKRPGDYNSEDDMDDDEDIEDDDDGGGMLLSDLLGGSSKKAPATKGKQPAKPVEEEEGDEEGSEEDEEGEEEEEDDDDGEDDEDEEMDVDHAGLLQMVEGLSGKGKSSDAAGMMAMELQNMPDSAFGTGLTQGLTLESMLDSLKDTRGIAAVRKQLVTLSQSGKAVSAPAPTIVQERAERQVVYGEKRKAVGEWLPLVSSARQADTLNFSYEPRQVASQAELVGKFEPENEMELAIRDLLTHAKADKEAKVEQSEAEALAARGFTVEQVKERQAELARMRALLFYEQQKRHRINKIKSKAYHRIRKRQRLRKEEGEQAALREADPEAAALLDEKAAMARVTERMSLKHKNTSKWAKHVLQHGAAHQADTRKAIAEQLHMGEELRRRAGALPGSGSEDEASESESDSDEDDEAREARLRKKAAGKIRGVLGEEEEGSAKGILGMKFMQRAQEKQRERAREEMNAVLRELEQDDAESSESEAEERVTRSKGKEKEKEGEGREVAMSGLQTAALAWGGQGTKVRVSGPISITGGSGQAEADGVEVEVAQEQAVGKGGGVAAETVSSGVLSSFRAAKPAAATNGSAASGGAGGWSTSAAGGGGQPAQVAGAAAAVSNPWLEAPVPSRAETRKQQKVVASIGKKKGKAAGTVLSTEEAVAAMEWDEEDGEEGDEGEGKEQGDGKGARVLIANTAEQKALVKRAFGAPDLEEDFAQDKAEQLQQEREEEAKKRTGKKGAAKEAVMGWGCWAGPGAPAPLTQPTVDKKAKGRGQRPPPKHEQRALQPVKPQAPAPIPGEVVKPRVDDKLPTVLINERRIKQASKFKLGEVPYPFTSREQYERSLRLPVGKEWNTTTSVREATRAPVIVKPGTIVEPIKLRKKHRAVFGEAPKDKP